MLGTTKNKGITDLKRLPPAANATEGKGCSYVGKDNSATILWYKFATPAAARVMVTPGSRGVAPL